MPDARVVAIDGATAVDATPLQDAQSTMVTVQVNPSVGISSADVRFEPPTGDAIEVTTDSNGHASATVPANSTVTIFGQQNVGIQAAYLAFSYVGVNPGDKLVVGPSDPTASDVDFDVNFTAFNQTATVEIDTPCGSQQISAGTTVAHFTGVPCASTDPMDILAVIRDGSNHVTHWTALLAQSVTQGQSFVLPSTWNNASTFGISLSHIPSVLDQVQHQVDEFSQGTELASENGAPLTPDNNGAVTGAVTYGPTTTDTFKVHLSSSSGASVTIHGKPVPTLFSYNFNTAAIPVVDSATLDPSSRTLSWVEEALDGTPTPQTAIIAITSYQIAQSDSTDQVTWFVMHPPQPATSGIVWPTLPSADAAFDVANGTNGGATISENFMSSGVTYDVIRPLLFDIISDSASVVNVPGGTFVGSSAPSIN